MFDRKYTAMHIVATILAVVSCYNMIQGFIFIGVAGIFMTAIVLMFLKLDGQMEDEETEMNNEHSPLPKEWEDQFKEDAPEVPFNFFRSITDKKGPRI